MKNLFVVLVMLFVAFNIHAQSNKSAALNPNSIDKLLSQKDSLRQLKVKKEVELDQKLAKLKDSIEESTIIMLILAVLIAGTVILLLTYMEKTNSNKTKVEELQNEIKEMKNEIETLKKEKGKD